MNFAHARELLDIVLDTVRERLTAVDARSVGLEDGLTKAHERIAQLQKDCADNANARVRMGQRLHDQSVEFSDVLDAQRAQIEQLEARTAELSARVESLTACLASVTADTRRKSANGKARAAPN